MKRTLDDSLEKSLDDEHKKKTYKFGDIILIEDNYKIKYDIESERNIFIRHYVIMKCPMCKKNISQYISMSYDYDPDNIVFESTQLQNHLIELHKDEILCIKKSTINIYNQILELVLTKKVIL